MVRPGSSNSQPPPGGAAVGGGEEGREGGGAAAAGGGGGGGEVVRRRSRSLQRSGSRSRRRRRCMEKISPSMRKVECSSPVSCHCKLACTHRTISLMFGCKVSGQARGLERDRVGGVCLSVEWAGGR